MTKNASAGVEPNSAPSLHVRVRKFVTAIRSWIHSFSSFGSNTLHCDTLHDRLGDVVEEPPDVDVAPLGVAGERAGAPDADAAAREGPDAVDPDLVEAALLDIRDLEAEPVDAERDLVRGRLVDAAGRVGAGTRRRPRGPTAESASADSSAGP